MVLKDKMIPLEIINSLHFPEVNDDDYFQNSNKCAVKALKIIIGKTS